MENAKELDRLFEKVYRESIGECHIVIKMMDSGLFSYIGEFRNPNEAQAFIDNLGINAIVIACSDLRSALNYVEEQNLPLGTKNIKVSPNPGAVEAAKMIEKENGLERCESAVSNAGVEGYYYDIDEITGALRISVHHDGGPLTWYIPPTYSVTK